jgi:rfaE bifunctional protein kinase chain/domain
VTTAEILAVFPKLRALVVGDVCLDRWCRYDPELAEESRETGIPRVAVVGGEVTPGAAGTVANNLAALRASQVDVLGVVGDDGHGYELERALRARGISERLLLKSPDLPTFTYTKLINCRTGEEDLHRVDYLNTRPLPESVEASLVARFEQVAGDYDVILVSDQAETSQGGIVTAALREAITRAAAARPDTVIWVDSRIRSEHFRGVIVKPNQQEAEAASVRALGRVDYSAYRQHLNAPLLIVTHGGEGALVVNRETSHWVRTRPVEKPVDICGAGDSFSAGAALALKATGHAVEAAAFGNLVASITIMKKGTGTASPEEVLAAATAPPGGG